MRAGEKSSSGGGVRANPGTLPAGRRTGRTPQQRRRRHRAAAGRTRGLARALGLASSAAGAPRYEGAQQTANRTDCCARRRRHPSGGGESRRRQRSSLETTRRKNKQEKRSRNAQAACLPLARLPTMVVVHKTRPATLRRHLGGGGVQRCWHEIAAAARNKSKNAGRSLFPPRVDASPALARVSRS